MQLWLTDMCGGAGFRRTLLLLSIGVLFGAVSYGVGRLVFLRSSADNNALIVVTVGGFLLSEACAVAALVCVYFECWGWHCCHCCRRAYACCWRCRPDDDEVPLIVSEVDSLPVAAFAIDVQPYHNQNSAVVATLQSPAHQSTDAIFMPNPQVRDHHLPCKPHLPFHNHPVVASAGGNHPRSPARDGHHLPSYNHLDTFPAGEDSQRHHLPHHNRPVAGEDQHWTSGRFAPPASSPGPLHSTLWSPDHGSFISHMSAFSLTPTS